MNRNLPDFRDPRSVSAWRSFKLRTELMLGSVSPSVRRELLQDLFAHVHEAVWRSKDDGDEYERLSTALAGIGDPKEFLAPLLADAVFRAPERTFNPGSAVNALAFYAGRGISYFLSALAIVVAGMVGFVFTVASLGSVLRPGRIGLFRLGEDNYQVRLLGFSDAGEPVLPVWAALIVLLVGAALLHWMIRRIRRLIVSIISEPGAMRGHGDSD